MPNPDLERLRAIKTFPSLVKYLRDDLDWPIESEDFDDLTFDFKPEELGIDPKTSAKIESIKQLRPLASNQPWGIFFIKFEPKKLPVVALRRILGQLVIKKRASANRADQQTWKLSDLLFLSNYGENEQRQITFAHFSGNVDSKNLPTLKVLGWDDSDTALHIDHVHTTLRGKLQWPDDENDLEVWRKTWSSAFILRHREVIETSKELAVKLAGLAQQIRKRANSILSIETKGGPLRKLMAGFKEALIHDLTEDSFADMYAQTIAYGLLTARITNPKGDNPDELSKQMPITNPFLKELMESFLSVGGRKGKSGKGGGIDFDELGINEVVALLDDSNMEAVVRDFGDKNPLEDPVIHFYELFLHEYDSEMRMQRGVFYTPRPVVSFIVRSVDEKLRTIFGLEDGLADITTWSEMAERNNGLKLPKNVKPEDPFVQILDPATGTGTFLVEVVELIHKKMVGKWEKGGKAQKEIEQLWNGYVSRHLLPRLYGYELLMAPYTIAHMKIGLKLHETGYQFTSDERARIYLTNSLEPPSDSQIRLVGILPALAHESQAVNKIKSHQHFTVVIGNPPYSGNSSNQGDWISNILKNSISRDATSYFEYKGLPLDERNTKWLNDDYVKFFRISQRLIDSSGVGIVGLITNHSWLDNPTFRGMRESLISTFPNVHVVDLHGNAKRKETAPDGSKDENVFEIQQGVAIALLSTAPDDKLILHGDLFGLRSHKYGQLFKCSVGEICQKEIIPDNALFLWRPIDTSNLHEYESYYSIPNIFSITKAGRGDSWAKGLATTKDHLFISFDQNEAESKVGLLASTSATDHHVADKLSLEDTPYFKIDYVRKAIREGDWKSRIYKVAYRPFDYRFIYWHPELYDVGRGASSKKVMRHLFQPNIAMITSRMTKGELFAHAFVSRHPVEVIFLSSKTSNNAFVFPKIYYPNPAKEKQISIDTPMVMDNFSPDFLKSLSLAIGENLDSNGFSQRENRDDIFNYLYSVLYSRQLRSRYADLLTIDFPRLPLPRSRDLFIKLSKNGNELVNLHLLETSSLKPFITTIVGVGDFKIEKIIYSDETVWIDIGQTKGFRGVPEEVWKFHIGGYQVCQKWLKDRRPKGGQPGRVLTEEDINHYQKVIVAISETIRIMAEIDEVIEEHGGWPGAFVTE
jgi:hypothetical protein